MRSSRSGTDRNGSPRAGLGTRIRLAALLATAALLASVATLTAPGTAFARPPSGGTVTTPTSTTSTTPPGPCLPNATNCGSLSTPSFATPTSASSQSSASTSSGNVPQISSQSPPPPGPDAFLSLGGGSPWCPQTTNQSNNQTTTPDIGAQGLENCRISGTIAAPHPVQNYGIDVPSFSLTHIADLIEAAIQGPISWAWMGFIWLVHGLLALLQWAFSLDLLNRAMSQLTSALNTLHNDLFGSAWMLMAMSVLGLWGIWNGLVRRKTIETLGGLAMAVAMMIAALVLIADPVNTVGTFQKDMDNAALATLSIGARGSVDIANPATSFVQTEGDLYSDLILRPWCALEFANIGYCTNKVDGTTRADIWLTFPPNSAERNALYTQTVTGSLQASTGELTHILNGFRDAFNLLGTAINVTSGGVIPAAHLNTTGVPQAMQQCHADYPTGPNCTVLANAPKVITKDPSMVTIQTFGDTFTRVALFLFIAIGLLGACIVLGYMALKLVMASIKAFIFTLAAPVVLFLPAFGEAGRMAFTGWAKRDLGAIVSKFVFAVMLAILLLIAGIINSLPFSWVTVWMLNIIFWWGVVFERKTIISYLSMDKRTTERAGLDVTGNAGQFRLASTLASMYFGKRVLQSGIRGATALPRGATRTAVGFTRNRIAARSTAVRNHLERGYNNAADTAIRAADRGKVAAADAVIRGDRTDRASRDALRKKLLPEIKGLETDVRKHQEMADKAKTPAGKARFEATRDTKQRDLDNKREQLAAADRKIFENQPALTDAIRTKTRLGSGDRVIDQREREEWRQQHQRDVARGGGALPARGTPEFYRAINRIGVSDHEYNGGTAAQQNEWIRAAGRQWDEDARNFRRTDGPRAAAGLPLEWRDGRAGMNEARNGGDPAEAARTRDEYHATRWGQRHPRAGGDYRGGRRGGRNRGRH